MKITLNKTQYRALNDLRGLPPGAHMMVMCSRITPTGGTLDGSEQDFEELVSFISGEIAEGMVSQRSLSALVSLCEKIDPDCVDWIGM